MDVWIAIIVIIGLIIGIVYSGLAIKKALTPVKVLHFQYDRKWLCRSNDIASNACPNQVNKIIYGKIRWVNANVKNILVSFYIATGSIPYEDKNLFTENYWITIGYNREPPEVYGAIRWSALYTQKINLKDPSKTEIPYIFSVVAAVSGPFNNFNKGNIFFDYREKIRNIYIYENNKEINKSLYGI